MHHCVAPYWLKPSWLSCTRRYRAQRAMSMCFHKSAAREAPKAPAMEPSLILGRRLRKSRGSGVFRSLEFAWAERTAGPAGGDLGDNRYKRLSQFFSISLYSERRARNTRKRADSEREARDALKRRLRARNEITQSGPYGSRRGDPRRIKGLDS